MNWSKIIECVPNFSEGRDLEKIDKIVAPFRGKSGVKLLDYSNDEDHNRLVVTLVGEPEALRDAVIEAIGIAVRLIDLNHHSGQHPRMGAVDVVPFIPIKNTTMEEAVALSKSGFGWRNYIISQSFCMKSPPQLRIGKIWPPSVRENLKEWRRKSDFPNGSPTSVLPSVIPLPER